MLLRPPYEPKNAVEHDIAAREPTNMSEADVSGLRALGLSNEQILPVVLITCTFNFMTRLADGLGVQVPEGRQEAHERWLTGPALQQDWLMIDKS